MAERKLDLFGLLGAISEKNLTYYEELPDESKKEFQPFVIMRWLTGTHSKRQVYFLNAVVNPFVFDLGQHHKLLMYYLLTLCTSGKQQRYTWTKPPSATKVSKLVLTVICDYFAYTKRQAIDAAKLLSSEDILDYAEQLGWQKEDITKLKKEFKSD